MEWKRRRGLELGENGSVFLEKFGGRGEEIEVGFERGERGKGEGIGGRRNYLVFEGKDFFEVFLSFDSNVEVWVTNQFDPGFHEAADQMQPVRDSGAKCHGYQCRQAGNAVLCI